MTAILTYITPNDPIIEEALPALRAALPEAATQIEHPQSQTVIERLCFDAGPAVEVHIFKIVSLIRPDDAAPRSFAVIQTIRAKTDGAKVQQYVCDGLISPAQAATIARLAVCGTLPHVAGTNAV